MLDYYASHGPITDPGPERAAFDELPADLPSLTRIVQGLVFHYFADEHVSGRSPSRVRPSAGSSAVAATSASCSARWRAIRASPRWKLLDPELSDRHVAHFKIGFDPFDVPRDAFLVGGRAWQVCRSGEADPDMFGLDPRAPQPRGMRFVRGHVVQDLAALNKVELLLWDIWGLMDAPPDTAVSLLDDVAERTLAGDSLTDLQRLYALPGLAVPPRVQCLSPARGPHEAVVV